MNTEEAISEVNIQFKLHVGKATGKRPANHEMCSAAVCQPKNNKRLSNRNKNLVSTVRCNVKYFYDFSLIY